MPFVLLFDKGFYNIRVVYACVCRMVFLYEFGLLVCLDVILVTIVLLTTFLSPSGINVLVRLFGQFAFLLLWRVSVLGIPQVFAVAGLDLLVLFLGVSLLRGFNKSSINDFPFVE